MYYEYVDKVLNGNIDPFIDAMILKTQTDLLNVTE